MYKKIYEITNDFGMIAYQYDPTEEELGHSVSFVQKCTGSGPVHVRLMTDEEARQFQLDCGIIRE